MLNHTFLMLTLSAFLSGGGLQGVVVEKMFKPLPLAHSLGVDGIYRLQVRDSENKLHRQMVSRQIFNLYEVGDQFDDSIAPAEVSHRKQAAQARKKVTIELAAETPARTERPAMDARTAQVFLKHDMLPETEGF
jgi:hypothetical protein